MEFKLEHQIAPGDRISKTEWENFQEDYLENREFEMNALVASSGIFHQINWLRLLPENAISRIRSEEDLDSVLREIIQETADNTIEGNILSRIQLPEKTRNKLNSISDREKRGGIEAGLCKQTGMFLGDVNRNQIELSDPEFSPGGFECPEGEIAVPIKIINDLNFVDYIIYSFDDAQSVFGKAYGNSTWMVRKIIERNADPDMIVKNTLRSSMRQDSVWERSRPPQHPITFCKDTANALEFWRVEDPQDAYRDSWGDLNKMKTYFDTVDSNHLSYGEKLPNASPVYWIVDIGMKY